MLEDMDICFFFIVIGGGGLFVLISSEKELRMIININHIN